MKTQLSAMVTAALLLGACALPSQLAPRPAPPEAATAAAPISGSMTEEVPAAAPATETITDPTMAIVGPMEIVYDWSTDRCAIQDFPDMPIRPFRDADGNVQANRSWVHNRRFLGPELDTIEPLCETILDSGLDADPSHYRYQEWIQALYTEDGQTIHAIVHNEHNSGDFKQDYASYWNMTYAVSTDGGASYQKPDPPGNLVAALPYKYEPGAGMYGLLTGSNIIKGKDDYYYMLALHKAYKKAEQSTCLLRTKDLSDAASWRAWDGKGFDMRLINPYLEANFSPSDHDCPAIDRDLFQIGGLGASESLLYSSYLDRYVALSLGSHWVNGELFWGANYATSQDLIHWENKKLLQAMTLGAHTGAGGVDGAGYLILLDPHSPSRNFETTDKTAYVYFSRFNHSTGMLLNDVDLVRFPVEFFPNAGEATAADVRTKMSLSRAASVSDVLLNGSLTDYGGEPLAGKTIELFHSPNDAVGIPYEYTFTGVVPDDFRKATVGVRVNTECNCNANSNFYVYEFNYSENGGSNLVQGNRFQNGLQSFGKWGSAPADLEPSDQGDGRMLHIQAKKDQSLLGLNSQEFTVTPGATFTYTVRSRVVPGSFGAGFFGLFFIGNQGEGTRVAIPFFNPKTPFGTVTTDQEGQFQFLWQSPPTGNFQVESSFSGDTVNWPSSITKTSSNR
ncbi:MAG: hypothetical protein V1755_15345 [Chloroflexota bacterium]